MFSKKLVSTLAVIAVAASAPVAGAAGRPNDAAIIIYDYEGAPVLDSHAASNGVGLARTEAHPAGKPGGKPEKSNSMTDVIWQGYANPADEAASGAITQEYGPDW